MDIEFLEILDPFVFDRMVPIWMGSRALGSDVLMNQTLHLNLLIEAWQSGMKFQSSLPLPRAEVGGLGSQHCMVSRYTIL